MRAQGPRAADRRRGAALRRQAEGAAAPAAAARRRDRDVRDADPAHAADVARRPARHLGDRDAARGPPAGQDLRRRVRRGARQAGARAREATRGGQAFFLHNRVETIDEIAERLRGLCPRHALRGRPRAARGERARDADAGVPARRRRRARVHLDHRVGHRHPAGQHADRRARRPLRPRPALPDPRARRPQPRARLRLPAVPRAGGADARRRRSGSRALSDFTELGAGFKIAMRDLELRGAGNLLGDEQSGHVAALGFELYMQMLDEAVAAREAEGEPASDECGAGAPRRRRRRLRAGRLRPLRAGEDRRPPPDRRRARRRRPRASCATSSRTASARCPSRWSNLLALQRARIKLGAAGARAVDASAAAGSSSTPIELDSERRCERCASGSPEARLRVRALAGHAAGARRPPTERFPAVVAAADALLAVEREPRSLTRYASSRCGDSLASLALRATKLRLGMALCAAIATAVTLGACGSGVPGNAVAQVGDATITTAAFDHWMTIARSPRPASRTPADAGAAAARCRPTSRPASRPSSKTAAKPPRASPQPTDAQLQGAVQAASTTALRDQVLPVPDPADWIEGEAADQGVKVTPTRRSQKPIDEQQEAAVPAGRPTTTSSCRTSGQTDRRPALPHARPAAAASKIAREGHEGARTVTDAQIAAYYKKNKAQFAQPETRDLHLVLTKTTADGREGQDGARRRPELRDGRQEVLDRPDHQGQRRQAARRLQGPAGAGLRRRRSSPRKTGELSGPVKTQFGYYVFTVDKITRRKQQTLDAGQGRRSSRCSPAAAAEGADAVRQGRTRKKWTRPRRTAARATRSRTARTARRRRRRPRRPRRAPPAAGAVRRRTPRRH